MLLAQAVEEAVRGTGVAQIEANDVGLAILEPLRKLDEVAFMRFASVYQGWESLDDFETAIQLLRLEHSNQEEQAGS
jgi:transcriptional repressor NrdR